MTQVATVAPATETRETALAFEAVSLVYPDGTEALRSIDLRVAAGEMVAVVGTSGCGKSSLLRIASGLMAPTSGTVVHWPDDLGYVFQDATLLPWRTVRANVGLLAELQGVAKRDRRSMVDAAIAQVGLVGFEDHYPHTLSGGMKMRVALARTLTLQPGCFLFDEPFGALDELTREHLHDQLLALRAVQPAAGLFVTHSVAEAVYLADRVVVLSSRPGRVACDVAVDFEGPRRPELRFDPAFARIARLISDALRMHSPDVTGPRTAPAPKTRSAR